jgi:hypothetical protein
MGENQTSVLKLCFEQVIVAESWGTTSDFNKTARFESCAHALIAPYEHKQARPCRAYDNERRPFASSLQCKEQSAVECELQTRRHTQIATGYSHPCRK